MSCSGHFYGDKGKFHQLQFCGTRLCLLTIKQETDFIRLSWQPPRMLLTRPLTVCLTWKTHLFFSVFFLFCLGGKHLKMFPSTSEKEKIISITKVSTGKMTKGQIIVFQRKSPFDECLITIWRWWMCVGWKPGVCVCVCVGVWYVTV